MQSKRITILFILILAFCPFFASGQIPKIDSLMLVLERHTANDTTRVNLLNALAVETYSDNPQQASKYAQQSLEISSQLNYTKGKAASLFANGLVMLRTDRKVSLINFREALKIAEVIDDKIGICNYLTAIGNVTKKIGDIAASNQAHQRALEIAQSINNKELILKIRINIARNMNTVGNHLEASKQLYEVIHLAEQGSDKYTIAAAYSNLAFIYQTQGDYPTALEYHFTALKLNEQTQNYNSQINNLINIAKIRAQQNEQADALETTNKALVMARERGDSARVSICYNNIGNIHKQFKNPQAIEYFQRSLALASGNSVSQTIDDLLNIGSILADNHDHSQALKNLNKALHLAQDAKLKRLLSLVYLEIGKLYAKQKQYPPAIQNIQQSFVYAQQMHYIEAQRDCQNLLAEIYSQRGDYKKAYDLQKSYKVLYDSVINDRNTRKIALLESSFIFDKEREVYELERSRGDLRIKNQQQTIFSLGVISLLVISLSLAIYWSGRLRKRVLDLQIESINNELETNKKAMAVAKLKLVQNAERDAHNIKILEDIGCETSGANKERLSSLVSNFKLQSRHSNWEEFEMLFSQVNSSFLEIINERYPQLTPNERKLCVFMKLNMGNKDIANITFQSEEALKKSRLRLRQKLNLDRSINLLSFIQSL